MTKQRILENGQRFVLFDSKGWHGPWIEKSAGTGRVFALLYDNKGKKVSLEDISDLSGWKNPQKQILELRHEVSGWTKYRIDRIEEYDKVYYKMVRK